MIYDIFIDDIDMMKYIMIFILFYSFKSIIQYYWDKWCINEMKCVLNMIQILLMTWYLLYVWYLLIEMYEKLFYEVCVYNLSYNMYYSVLWYNMSIMICRNVYYILTIRIIKCVDIIIDINWYIGIVYIIRVMY